MSAFTESVDQQLDGVEHVSPGAIAGCDECWDGYTDPEDEDARGAAEEGHFSRYSCDGCGSTFGGDRYPVHGILAPYPRCRVLHLDVCVDCLMYLANGDEPEDWQQYPS